MFLWYQQAGMCFAYLGDIDAVQKWEQSEWWRRGWTLQELIAPRDVLFYTRSWQFIGSKIQYKKDIACFAGVPEPVLSSRRMYMHYTVAQKLSWAAGRVLHV